MIPVYSADEAKRADRYTTERFGIDSKLLMEKAAFGLFEEVKKVYEPGQFILGIAGLGNNGADVVACIRMLHMAKFPCKVLLVGDGKTSELMEEQLEILKRANGNWFYACPNGDSEENLLTKFGVGEVDSAKKLILLDGLFGIGLNREVTGIFAECIDWMNALHSCGAKVLSMDIPSGISADSGAVLGAAVYADITVVPALLKTGLLIADGRLHAGRLAIWDMGIYPENERSTGALFTKEDCNLPVASPGSNKGSNGKLLLIAGSDKIHGALRLAYEAATKLGVGMVHVVTHERNRALLFDEYPECLCTCYEDAFTDEFHRALRGALAWCDAVLIGPGIGTEPMAVSLVEEVLSSEVPAILDADALNILALDRELITVLRNRIAPSVVTPHVGESLRLLPCSLEEWKRNRHTLCSSFTEETNVYYVAKDHATVLYGLGEKRIFNNGNESLAHAGSGDVLAGLIGAILARCEKNPKAIVNGVSTAVYVHGMLAEQYRFQYNDSDSCTASELLQLIPAVRMKF